VGFLSDNFGTWRNEKIQTLVGVLVAVAFVTEVEPLAAVLQ